MWFCITVNAQNPGVFFLIYRSYGSRTVQVYTVNNSRARFYTKPHTEIDQTLSFPTQTQKKESGLGTRLGSTLAHLKLTKNLATFMQK